MPMITAIDELPAFPARLRDAELPQAIQHFLDHRSYLYDLLAELRAREERELFPPETERAWAEVLERCDTQLMDAARALIEARDCSAPFVAAKALVVFELSNGHRNELGAEAAKALAKAVLQYFGTAHTNGLRAEAS